MPRFDKTGPEGKGSQTGRGMGKCNPSEQSKHNSSDSEKTSGGRGAGRRRGFGRGLGRALGFGKGNS
ncbi:MULTISPECIES: DUF5320 domain-containing protein [unclassified Saccharicrinis]|uniref:DUF5320 domain-containing protein n=1 Tax=unclassified Saccharicrinis TaxID=2646859 RepID=UPI003D34F109